MCGNAYNRYVKESDGVEVSKYDLAKLGYRMIEDNNDSYSDDPRQMPAFFKALLKEIDTNQDGELSPAKIKQAYQTPEIRSQLEKLIVKNESEWHQGGRVKMLYESFLNLFKTEEQRNVVNHEMTRIKELEFMSKVPNMGAEVWHMWPLMFGSLIKSALISSKMLAFSFNNATKEELNIATNEINSIMNKADLNSELRLCHFLGQCKQETNGHILKTENINYSVNTLKNKFSYYRKNPLEAEEDGRNSNHGANQETIANKVYANRIGNGDITSGDGWRYRGRGIKQLTGRRNYQDFTRFHREFWEEDIDFEANPELLATVPKYAIRSGIYFWKQHNLAQFSDIGATWEASKNISNIVNRYDGEQGHRNRYNFMMDLFNNHIFKNIFNA